MARRSSTLLTLVVGGLLTVVAAMAGLLWYQSALDNQADALTLDVVQEVLGAGNPAPLVQAASPALRSEMNTESLTSYVNFVNRRMGTLQSIEAISGGSDVMLLPVISDGAPAHYAISLQFDNGAASALFDLTLESGSWRIEDFRVDSALLLE